ncbi:DUF416 family protein [Scytonema sp. NUACC26]|uniref:DUF416 family protein n=1 Tax=Scytonema sp. NUACC26 TaxID=3140176 RepID=UPI0034DCB786
MNLHLYNFDALEKELEGLSPLHRIAFAASCCQRLLLNYNAFSHQENWGNPSVLRTALDEVWQILQGKPVDAALIRRLIEDCSDVIPDSDEFTSPNLIYDVEAQEAAIAICNTLEACLDPTPEQIIKVATCVTNTIDAFVPHKDKSFNVSESKVGLEKLQEAIGSHPVAVREMAKQSEDLQRLNQAEKLDRDFVEWLRTSFDNDGKSLIDLA